MIASLAGHHSIRVEKNWDDPLAVSRAVRKVKIKESCQDFAWHRDAAQVDGACGAVTNCDTICNMIGIFKRSRGFELSVPSRPPRSSLPEGMPI